MNAKKIRCDRVVVATDGSAVSWQQATQDYGIQPDVIFVRNDGWTLGAPNWLRNVAYALWSDCWTKVIELN